MGSVSRRLHLGRLAVAGMAALGLGVIAEACADGGYAPLWKLDKIAYDSGGSSAILTPGNDTRVNLLLLLADRRGTLVRDPAAKQEGPPLVLFPWAVMAAGAVPAQPDTTQDNSEIDGSRCQSNAAGKLAFVAAVGANAAIPAPERERLIQARSAMSPKCDVAAPAINISGYGSAAGRAFATYLSAAGQFYAGDYAGASASFASLTKAPDPWLRETGAYMVARTALNFAQASAFDEYGSLKDVAKRDQPTIAAAGTAFDAYLRAYPRGHYAASARGLQRRVAWLGGNQDRVAAAYDEQVARTGAFDGSDGPFELAQEIDLKLLSVGGAEAVRDPMLLATVDLQRMRCDDEARQSCTKQIGQDELERQAPLFARDKPLFDYVRAAHALFVRRQPREVLALIPDASHQARFSTVQFSRQMLRGLALDAVGDRNARGFWLSLLPGAVAPYQRPAVELALATHDENSGHVEAVFAPGSQVTHPVMRELLLEHVAGPALLRQQARDAHAPRQERDVALFMLLTQELRRGFYADFLSDVRMLPTDASSDGSTSGAASYDALFSPELTSPPLGWFRGATTSDDTSCPPYRSTVAALAAAPGAVRPRLCLAEYFRDTGFDQFESYGGKPERGLGSSPSQFPGKPYSRLDVYRAVMVDPRATPDDRALALNRAIRCYGPSGYNSCGGAEASKDERRSWFVRLKRDHAASHWAQSLKLYW